MRKLIAAALALTIAVTAFAEIAPEEYEKMQRESPELLQLQIVSVKTSREMAKPEGCRFFEFEVRKHVVVKANVVGVVRTASTVRPGDAIEIAYTSINRCTDFAGPRSIPLLKKGTRVYAFLTKKDPRFAPAAMGASFSSALPTAESREAAGSAGTHPQKRR